MKLNAQIIKEDLSDICTDAIISGNVLERNLRFPVLYNDEDAPLGDRVYLVCASRLPSSLSLKNHPTLICIGKPEPHFLSGKCDLIAVDEGVAVEQLLSRVVEIFDRYGDWESQIHEAVINNEAIEKLGTISDPIFENPIYLYDTNLEYIFRFFNTKRYDLPEGYNTLEDYFHLGLEEISLAKMQPGFVEMTESKTPVILENDFYTVRSMTQNIFYNGHCLGRLYIDEVNRKFSDKDLALIVVLADAVLGSMRNNGTLNYGQVKQMDEVLTKMLNRKLVAEKAFVSALHKLGWDVYDEYFCMTVEPTDFDRKGKVLSLLAARLAVAMPDCCYAQFDGKIVFVLNLSTHGSNRNDLLTIVTPILRDNMLKAGISTVYTDFKNLFYYYRQTCIALQIGKKKKAMHWYHKFDDYILEHILESSVKGLIPDTLLPEGLRQLRSYDAQKGTNFTQSLQAYLELGMNITECTRKLYLHRNTFLYRLERAKEILNMDLDDPNIRLILLIVLRIVE